MATGGVLFDIDGVLVTSWQPIDGARETLRALAASQIARAYLTNTTTRTRVQIADLLSMTPHLFRASLRDNVTLFAAEADDKAVSAALQKAALSELLTDEKSLDRMLGDGNASLSSGQLRRLGLARALYRDTPVLLLDEITAGLDEKNEHQVLSTIVAHCYNHTILLATHRSAAQELTDQILLLDAGRAWSYTPAGEDEPKGGLSS